MDTQQRESVNSAAVRFNQLQGVLDRAYARRMKGEPVTLDSQSIEDRATNLDHDLGQVLAYFTHEQMNEYMRQTSLGSIV